jgi:hypothetical protein
MVVLERRGVKSEERSEGVSFVQVVKPAKTG